MDRHTAIASLPTLHAVAIRLRDVGADSHMIAQAVDLDDDQVPTLLEIADAKLARILVGPEAPGR